MRYLLRKPRGGGTMLGGSVKNWSSKLPFRRFPPLWSVEEREEYFIVRDATGHPPLAISISGTSRSVGPVPNGSQGMRRDRSLPTSRRAMI